MHKHLILIFTLCALDCVAADQEYYRQFLSVVDTNLAVPHVFRSPLLTDTSNTNPKLTNSTVSLKKVTASGEIAGVKLGMTMDEVVSVWGKPLQVRWLYGDGAPCFLFGGVDLAFKGNQVEKVHIFDRTFLSQEGLGYRSKVEDWTRVLGEPTQRIDRTASLYDMLYDAGQATFRLVVTVRGRIDDLYMERPVSGTQPKE